MRKIVVALLTIAALSSCVSTKKFNSMKAEALRAGNELERTQEDIARLTASVNALEAEKARLTADTVRLNKEYETLHTRYQKLLADGSAEAARMLRELENNQLALNERSRRVDELESMLRSREEAIANIRRKVTDALTGFEGKGLTISTRDGNVYVSMDDKLLFKSGSFEIDPNGAEAVRNLGRVLAQNPDINVMVEGHTDDVPYRSSGNLKDNLDLSVKRATTVTRLLLENSGIDATRIISAGRGEFLPVAAGKTSEARAKNRRTEIILTPKLDELMQIMETN